MARREAGEGSIYKRENNGQIYWTAQIYTHKDPITDKWKKITFTNKRKSECTDWLVKTKADILNGEQLNNSQIMFKNYLEHYLNFFVKNNRSVNTFKLYSYYIYTKIFTSNIINKLIYEITPTDINYYIFERQKSGDSIYLLNKQLATLKTIFNYAVKNDVIKKNPAQNIEQIKESKEITRSTLDEDNYLSFSKEEQENIINVLDLNSYKDLAIYIMFCSGLRPSECLALNGEDICDSTINVNKQYIYTNVIGKNGKHTKREFFSKPKNTQSIRVVPIPESAYNKIKPHLKSGLLFKPSYKTSFPITRESLSKYFYQILKTANVDRKGRTLHKIRHTYATRLFEAGADIKTVAKLMGHKGTNMLMNIYLHVHSEHKIETVNLIDNLF